MDALDGQQQARRLVDLAAHAVHTSRVDYHRLSGDFEVAENDLNEGLSCYVHWLGRRPRQRVQCLVGRTTGTATICHGGEHTVTRIKKEMPGQAKVKVIGLKGLRAWPC